MAGSPTKDLLCLHSLSFRGPGGRRKHKPLVEASGSHELGLYSREELLLTVCVHVPACVPVCIPVCVPAHVPMCVHVYLCVYLHVYLCVLFSRSVLSDCLQPCG